MLHILDLFSGIGGFSYAAERLVGGFLTKQFVEIDPYCCSVLSKHWPDVPIHDDVQTFTASIGSFDVITAGFPCQDLSRAGKQAGLHGARSGLFYEVMRLAREIQPRFVLLENVGNLLSHANGETFQEILCEIASAGFDAEWACIPASDLGACHKRERIWILAYSSQLFGYGSGCGHSRQLGKRALSKPGDSDRTPFTDTGRNRLEGEEWPRPHPATWTQTGIRRLNPDWGGYVSEPVLCRGDDGLSNRVDRLKALGNSIVPQVAAVALQRIQDLACDQQSPRF